MSKFLGTLSNSLRDNISHVATAAAGVTSNGPEPVFDRMQVLVHTHYSLLLLNFLYELKSTSFKAGMHMTTGSCTVSNLVPGRTGK